MKAVECSRLKEGSWGLITLATVAPWPVVPRPRVVIEGIKTRQRRSNPWAAAFGKPGRPTTFRWVNGPFRHGRALIPGVLHGSGTGHAISRKL